ncbi:MAG: hypothetical protein IPK00_22285 [Deltaproteobacteria bacterium]|nr:hypothetical protein [Deltaproteobacteria bacterium]
MSRPARSLLFAALAWVGVAWVGVGCATYSDRMQAATTAVESGAYADGLTALNKALRVDSEQELPERWRSNDPLTVLERGIVLQSLGRYAESSHDLQAAEQEIELLDMRVGAVGALGKYLYSDAAGKYKAPPSERLALNAINLLNYLARGDLEGAAVEARRFQTQREYLSNNGVDAPGPASLGAYLAGVVFEKLGEGDRALRYYEEAMAGAGPLESLREPVNRLAKSHPYRGPRIEALLAQGAPTGAPAGSAAGAGSKTSSKKPAMGEILVVTAVGRVPRKVPERMPIGAAVGIAGTILTDDLSVLQHSVFKVLVIPALQPVGSGLSSVAVAVDGEAAPLELVTNLGASVAQEFEGNKPRIIAAGISRLVARAAVAEGARIAGSQAGGDSGNLIGALLGLATEAALVAADRPDTRSWTMLPGRVLAMRMPVRAGAHTVEIGFGEAGALPRQFQVNVAPGGLATVVVTEPR